jgi:hypothetical protein
MTPDIQVKNLSGDKPLCIDRKVHDSPVKDRQAAFVNRFRDGCHGELASFQEAQLYPVSHPWVIRGMKFTAGVQECWANGRTFYYIDNGYFGNLRTKTYFRIIKNHVHDIRNVIVRPQDRLDKCEIQLKKLTPGRKILLAPPSLKSLTMWNMTPEQWIEDTVAEIKKHSDRPIELRLKRPRGERLKEDTMEEALADDVHCLVTYNSVAAVEAVMLGKPAFVLGPNAAHAVANLDLTNLENPRFPSNDERDAWLRHLSYSQFTFAEMSNGYAWRILNGD